jgi:hypothetical protein
LLSAGVSMRSNDTGAYPALELGPISTSKSMSWASTILASKLASDAWLAADVGPGERDEGGGGGARGGGSLLELGLEYRGPGGGDDSMASRDPTESVPRCDSEEPSDVEGAMSERKERSLADNARDLRFSLSDAAAGADGFRENRLKNRETADGWVAVALSASAVAVGETGVGTGVGDVIRDDVAVPETSMLGRADVTGDAGLDVTVGDLG